MTIHLYTNPNYCCSTENWCNRQTYSPTRHYTHRYRFATKIVAKLYPEYRFTMKIVANLDPGYILASHGTNAKMYLGVNSLRFCSAKMYLGVNSENVCFRCYTGQAVPNQVILKFNQLTTHLTSGNIMPLPTWPCHKKDNHQ